MVQSEVQKVEKGIPDLGNGGLAQISLKFRTWMDVGE